jgi:hypothetical protein
MISRRFESHGGATRVAAAEHSVDVDGRNQLW